MKEILKRNLLYIVALEIFVILWILYTLGITDILLPFSLNQYASNFIYSALGVLLIAGPRSMRLGLRRRLYIGVIIMIVINVAVELTPIFPSPVEGRVVPLSNTADVFDLFSGLVGVSVIWLFYTLNWRSGSNKTM